MIASVFEHPESYIEGATGLFIHEVRAGRLHRGYVLSCRFHIPASARHHRADHHPVLLLEVETGIGNTTFRCGIAVLLFPKT